MAESVARLKDETHSGLFKEVWEIEHHLHNRERWCGISADQSGNNWALEDGLTPFVAVSGAGAFGSEAKVLGTDDTPTIAGNLKFDMHRMLIVDQDNATPWYIRVIWGTGTVAAAESAGQYSTVMFIANIAGPPVRPNGMPVEVKQLRLDVAADKVWVKVKNATNLAEIDFFVGIHEYTY